MLSWLQVFGLVKDDYLVIWFSFRLLRSEEVKTIYPNKIQRKDDRRVFVMNTLFNLAETFLIAALVDYLDNRGDYERTSRGWLKDGEEFTFSQLFKVEYTINSDKSLYMTY